MRHSLASPSFKYAAITCFSHLLATLSEAVADQVVFWGGTALARTHLPGGRWPVVGGPRSP